MLTRDPHGKLYPLDVIATTDLVVYVLNKTLFINLIGSIKRHRMYPERERYLSVTIINDVYMKQIAQYFQLSELNVIKQLGRGGYGTVQLVTTSETKS